MIAEVKVCVKVKLAESALANEAVRKFAFQVHYQLQHLVVGLARKHDAARVEFIDGHGG